MPDFRTAAICSNPGSWEPTFSHPSFRILSFHICEQCIWHKADSQQTVDTWKQPLLQIFHIIEKRLKARTRRLWPCSCESGSHWSPSARPRFSVVLSTDSTQLGPISRQGTVKHMWLLGQPLTMWRPQMTTWHDREMQQNKTNLNNGLGRWGAGEECGMCVALKTLRVGQ